jgi:hypothetical protein
MRAEDRRMALQIRCIECHREQWAPIVHKVSLGKAACYWCGKKSRKMTFHTYSERYNCGYEEVDNASMGDSIGGKDR